MTPAKRFDVVALIAGVCFAGLALAVGWTALVGPVRWAVVKVTAPVVLVVVGVAGLALSRNRP